MRSAEGTFASRAGRLPCRNELLVCSKPAPEFREVLVGDVDAARSRLLEIPSGAAFDSPDLVQQIVALFERRRQ